MKHLARILLCITLLSALNANAQPERPRLVVGIVVDQMRWDFLYTFHDQWRSDGFRRLLEQGFSCANTMIDYVPTVTACGHASVYTGTTPAVHGIAGNNYKINGITPREYKMKHLAQHPSMKEKKSAKKAKQTQV